MSLFFVPTGLLSERSRAIRCLRACVEKGNAGENFIPDIFPRTHRGLQREARRFNLVFPKVEVEAVSA